MVYSERRKGGGTVNKKNLIVVALVTFCLVLTLFRTIPTFSSSVGDYNPWLDMNDDGFIDGSDLIQIARAFGTAGDPVNKTELLYNVSDTLTSLLAKIDSLNATVIEQQNIINNLNNTVLELQNTTSYLNTTVNYLNQTVIVLNSTKGLGAPDNDSGWIPIGQGSEIIYTHNLNTTDLLVYMIGKFNDSSSPYIHQIQYGSDNNYGLPTAGARWYDLTSTTIRVRREIGDQNWVWVRLIFWKIP
jgi:uncharacterized coiled-coil protein SlyX